jgi:trans-2,3-dihydro-3-hydroxyanthranilate isomerase
LRRKFHTLDVFTERPLAGNPLAVVLDCDGLDTARMQAIAREFNLSETGFVLEPADPVNTARLRIFTPSRELPFAGHPTLGAAILIAELRASELLSRSDVALVLEEAIGLVTCNVRHRQGQGPRASFALPELPQPVARSLETADIAAALGLEPEEIGFDRHVPTAYSAGVPFTFVPVAEVHALTRARIRPALFEAAIGPAAFLYSRAAAPQGTSFHARMFAPGYGVSEDPATGAAAAAFAGVVVQFENFGDGEHGLVIEQGLAMGRPSHITLSLEIAEGALISAAIGGAAVLLMQGILDL